MWNIITFEISHRLRRPAPWIYFGILMLGSFLVVAIEDVSVGTLAGQVKENAPSAIAQAMINLSLFSMLITSAVMGHSILRDYETRASSMFFTSPISKGQYLFGRFTGSFFLVVLINLGIPFGLMLGAVGWPWQNAENFFPINLYHYLQPFFTLLLPNLFFTSALFFMGGALSKRLLFVFVQGIGLLTLYIIALTLVGELDNKEFAAVIDPLGLATLGVVGEYWTVAEQNTQLFPLEGLLLLNRVIWVLIGMGALALTYFRFSFDHVRKSRKKAAKQSSADAQQVSDELPIPQVQKVFGARQYIPQVFRLARLYFVEVVKSLPFIAIVLFGLIILTVSTVQLEALYGADSIPSTYRMLAQLEVFTLFFLIILVFYSGELIWRERDLRMDLIYDALPIPNAVGMIAKYVALAMVYILLLIVLMFIGMGLQASKGYFVFEMDVYLGSLFTRTFAFLLLYTFMAFFIHVMVNNKYLGHALIILFFVVRGFLDDIGLEHNMFSYGSGSLGSFSDMNRFGHYFSPFSWFKIYWFGLAMVLFSGAIAFSVRGTDTLLKTRSKLAKLRFVRPLAIFSFSALALFAFSGTYIYYNTNVLNEYQNSDEDETTRADYEKTLKKYQDVVQPRIVETTLDVDVFPYERNFDAKGHYFLKNKSEEAISTLHIQLSTLNEMSFPEIRYTRMDSIGGSDLPVQESWEEFGYTIYEINPPLQPGDSMRMDWRAEFRTNGFVESGSNTSVVFNGTFFNSGYFPGLGYNAGAELSDKDDRKKQGLEPERERMRSIDDPIGHKMNLFGDDADRIRFEITVSTSPDQIAIAPGYLQRTWEEEGRKYFHYKMDDPMINFYSIVSARYEVMREEWEAPYGETINLEIYYHKGHEYNLDRMMEAMKHSLTYYSEHFSPYQYRQMRIMEFPRYSSFAQSFANTVPFSEGIGFVVKIEEDDVDIAYYVTAHEMAHQWWGHQVTEAQVQGNAMLSETMSQYSALMVMKEKYSPEQMQEFLRYELNTYLRGRASEDKKEKSLALVESQSYIHYRKGSLVMYALQDYISEDSVNAALKRYIDDWAYREDRYVTTDSLIAYFRDVTPDSLQYLITDMFETITLYDNRIKNASYSETGENSFVVDADISTIKYRADSLGAETKIEFADWIDVGVFGETEAGKDTLLYLKKHQFDQEETTLQIKVSQKPTKVGIDPINKLIDRDPDNNRRELKEKES